MPWLVGLKKARELLYTGDLINAEEALRVGMINHVLPDEVLEDATLKYAVAKARSDLLGHHQRIVVGHATYVVGGGTFVRFR